VAGRDGDEDGDPGWRWRRRAGIPAMKAAYSHSAPFTPRP